MTLTKEQRTRIEECCDALAFDIDEVEGQLTDDQLDASVDKAASDAGIDRTIFLAAFQELYECNPFTYRENAEDDAADAKMNPRAMASPVLEMNDGDDVFDPVVEGIVPLKDEEAW